MADVGCLLVLYRWGGKSNWMDFILSLNTALMILFYLGLTRGKELQIGEYFITGVTLAVVLVVGGLSFKWFPGAHEPQILYGHWSLCLNDRPDARRLGTSTPIWQFVCSSHSLSLCPSPTPVYQSVLSDIEHPLPLPIRDAVLTLLAMLKIFFGAAVVYQVGFLPAKAETVVRAPIPADRAKGKDPYWPAFPLALLGVGTILVLGITIAEKQLWVQVREELRSVATWIIVTGAIIAIISNLKTLLGRKEKAV